jgi:hypothetical protein
MSKSAPWFRVYDWIIHLPKFSDLSRSERGDLLTVWLLGYANDSERGRLPDLKTIARAFSSQIASHPSKVISILDNLKTKGWIDQKYDQNTQQSFYTLHDWQFWQKGGDHSTPRVRTHRNQLPHDPSEKSARSSVLIGQGNTENKALPQICNALLEVETNNSAPAVAERAVKDIKLRTEQSPDDFEDMLNTPELVLECDTPKTKTKHRKKPVESDPRLIPLKAHIKQSWHDYRNSDISACTSSADWSQFAKMLKRTRNAQDEFSLSALMISFTKFAASKDLWDRRQDLRYWSTHPERYMRDTSIESRDKRYMRDRKAKEQASNLVTLRAVQASAPELLSAQDLQLLADHADAGNGSH